MRTLLVAPALHSLHGGIPRILRLYQRALADLATAGDRIDVLALNDTPAEAARAAGPRIGCTAGCSRRKLAFAWQLLRLGWRAHRVVCGHIHLAPAVRLLQQLRPHMRVYLVGHGIEVWRPLSGAQRRALLAAERMLCVSQFTASELLKHNPDLPADRLAVVPNGLDPDFGKHRPAGFAESTGSDAPPPAESTGDRPRATAGQPPRPRLLTVARLTSADRDKGIDTIIAALPLVRTEFPSATLRIVGAGDDAPRLADAARSLGLTVARAKTPDEGRPLGPPRPHSRARFPAGPPPSLPPAENSAAIVFTGALPDAALHDEYAAGDVFVLPSRKEGFGLVYLEAMAFGKPCIAARAGGAPEVVDGPAGRLVPYGDPAALAIAIKDVLRRPPDPAAVRAHAAKFRYEAFRARLAAALAQLKTGARN